MRAESVKRAPNWSLPIFDPLPTRTPSSPPNLTPNGVALATAPLVIIASRHPTAFHRSTTKRGLPHPFSCILQGATTKRKEKTTV